MWSETASSAKLYLPLQWRCKNGRKDDTTCTIDWDSKERILKILNEEQEILDIIYPMDIIGVNVEFQMSNDDDDVMTTMAKTTAKPKHLSNSEKSLHHKSYTIGERVSLEDSNHDNSKNEGKSGILDNVPNSSQQQQKQHSECYDTAVNNSPQAVAILNLYTYPKKAYPSSIWSRLWSYLSSCHRQRQQTLHPNPSQRSGPRYAQHYSFPVVPMFDLMAITDLARAIRDVSGLNQSQLNTTQTSEDHSNSQHRMTSTPRKCIVILNPKSGRKKASQVWNSLVQRMLEYEAGFEITFFETLRPGHATEYLRDFVDLDTYDTLLCLGGDGIIHEVISGLYLRKDVKQVLSTLRLGVIGCGTGNGLAKSLTFASGEHSNALESAFLVARGNAIWIDLGRYQTTDKSYTSFLTFTWGMIADLDIESEVARFLGSFRIDLWAALCVIRGRRYRGRLSYLPATSSSSNSQHSQDSPSDTRNVLHPTLSDPVTSDWIVIEDEFILLWTSQVTHAAENTYQSPRSHLQDGVFHIMVLRGKKRRRWDIARILLSLESGGHVHHPAVEIIECIAFRLEPLCQGSYNVLDGEVIQSGPVQGYVMPTCLQAFCQYPSIDSEKLKVD